MKLKNISLLILGILGLMPLASHAAGIFTENFQYTQGANLDGQSGGSGFSGAWTGGNSTIVQGIGGPGTKALQVGTQSSRSLLSTFNTSGNSFYMSYIMNASSFSGGNYTGISLWSGSSENMFIGIPWASQSFGFDAHGGNGAADIKTIDFTPASNTSYLVTFGLLPSLTSGKVDVKMWATSNLNIDANTLVAGTPNASLLGSRSNFTFDKITVNGDYAGALKLSGLSAATTASETVNSTVSSVPEPSAFSLLALGLSGVMAMRRVHRIVDSVED